MIIMIIKVIVIVILVILVILGILVILVILVIMNKSNTNDSRTMPAGPSRQLGAPAPRFYMGNLLGWLETRLAQII